MSTSENRYERVDRWRKILELWQSKNREIHSKLHKMGEEHILVGYIKVNEIEMSKVAYCNSRWENHIIKINLTK